MQQDKETRQRLIESATAEFMEKGYTKASLRTICSSAGVTTGALYFLFKDKADLFRAIVGDFVDSLFGILTSHFQDERTLVRNPDFNGNIDDHSLLAQALVHHIYSNYDIALLLLNKSQGSEYENIVERIIELIETGGSELTEEMAQQGGKKKKFNRNMFHLVISMVVDAIVRLVSNEPDEQKALASIKKVFKMTMHSWTDAVFD